MSLYRTTPPISGRMGALWCLSGIEGSAVVEYGCMGHMAYGRTFLHQMGSQGSKLYSTHIGETDIAMGDVSKLFEAVTLISQSDEVKYIFLLPSSVPEVIGVDLESVSMELASQFPYITFIPITLGGFDTCASKAIEDTLLLLSEKLTDFSELTKSPTYSIIGSCADMFRHESDLEEITRLMKGAFSMDLLCSLSSNTNIGDIKKLSRGHINIVIRREGLKAAQYLKKEYGTPYTMARPYGVDGTINWIREIESLGMKSNQVFIDREVKDVFSRIEPIRMLLNRFLQAHKEESKLILAGHADVVEGIGMFAKEIYGFHEIVCYCDCQAMEGRTVSYLSDDVKIDLVNSEAGFLMGSGELLEMAGKDKSLQISNPDNLWRHKYEPPLMGFRGAVNLSTIWANEMMRKD